MFSIFVRFSDYNGKVLTANGQYDGNVFPVSNSIDVNNSQFFMIDAFSSDVEQTLNIGSQSTGAGAGKISFNPCVITRQVDAASPLLFQVSASGMPFKTIEVFFLNASSQITVKYLYKMAAIKAISWTADAGGERLHEILSFDYGGLLINSNVQNAGGKLTIGAPAGWNRIKNMADNDPNLILK